MSRFENKTTEKKDKYGKTRYIANTFYKTRRN